MLYVHQIYQTETCINVILILTVSPLSDYKNPSPGVSKRKLRELCPRGSSVLLLSMFTGLHAMCVLYRL